MVRVKILLADDHTILRQGLIALLTNQNDFTIVGEASNGYEVMELMPKLRPDVVVLDLIMDHINELGTLKQIKEEYPGTHVIMLSMHDKEAYVAEAIRNGASAYVLKESSMQDLVKAIRMAINGERFLSPPLSEEGIMDYMRQFQKVDIDPYETLTGRQRDVLYMASQGLTNIQIAERLGISARTVEIHRAKMMDRLGLNNTTELILYAVKKGLLPVEE